MCCVICARTECKGSLGVWNGKYREYTLGYYRIECTHAKPGMYLMLKSRPLLNSNEVLTVSERKRQEDYLEFKCSRLIIVSAYCHITSMIRVIDTPYTKHRTPFAPSRSVEFLPTIKGSWTLPGFTILGPQVVALTCRIEYSITITHMRKVLSFKKIDNLLNELSGEFGQHDSGLMMSLQESKSSRRFLSVSGGAMWLSLMLKSPGIRQQQNYKSHNATAQTLESKNVAPELNHQSIIQLSNVFN